MTTQQTTHTSDSKVFMQDIFEQQKHAFLSHPYPQKKERKEAEKY